MPVSVKLDVPAGASGLIQWSRLGDDSSFEFAGFVDEGVAIAEARHFSEGFADADPPEACLSAEVGDALCKDPKPAQDCRQLCGCVGSDPSLPNANLCGTNPNSKDAACPPNPSLPPVAQGDEQLAERAGEVCTGWGWLPTKEFLCDCKYDAASTTLCPLPLKMGPSGTLECHSTIEGAATPGGPDIIGPQPKTPDPTECVLGDPDRTLCDYSFDAFEGASMSDQGYCTGYDASGLHGGHLENCQLTEINDVWKQFSGLTANCRSFDKDPNFPDMRSDDDLQRCRLTPDQWSKLQNRRMDCGMPLRGAKSAERETTFRNEKGAPIYVTLSILDVPAEAQAMGYAELTGLSSGAWIHRKESAPCPPEVNVAQDWKCIGYSYEQKKDEVPTGKIINNNTTGGHAEGDALLQLAEQRGRSPAPLTEGDDPCAGDIGAGGRTGGCAEMLVDRAPCAYACANGGIYNAMGAAGLDRLISRSPEGCLLFEPTGPKEGVPCDDATTCASP